MIYALTQPHIRTHLSSTHSLQPIAPFKISPVRDQFSGKQKRIYVEPDPALVEEYLERMKQYDQQSQDRFIDIFELQMKNLPMHITKAIAYGTLDNGIGWMNGIIRGCLKDRASKPKKGETEEQQQAREEKIFKANQRLSSLTVAQHDYLKHIGREDLVTQYKEWKASRDAKEELAADKPKGIYRKWIDKHGLKATWILIAGHAAPFLVLYALTGKWPTKVNLDKVKTYNEFRQKVIEKLPVGEDYLIFSDTSKTGEITTTIKKK